jgi:DNA repair exonuclease SbcCD ATPase subunit
MREHAQAMRERTDTMRRDASRLRQNLQAIREGRREALPAKAVRQERLHARPACPCCGQPRGPEEQECPNCGEARWDLAGAAREAAREAHIQALSDQEQAEVTRADRSWWPGSGLQGAGKAGRPRREG